VDKLKRPLTLSGTTRKVATGCGNMYITINHSDNDGVIEVFATLGKAGGCAKCTLEAVTRCITLGLKYGIPLSEFANELLNCRCPSPALDNTSCIDAISKVFSDLIKEESQNAKTPTS
jgi:ribonucleoside-diphosphate reductase alpha chain